MMGIPESQYRFVYARTNAILGAGDPDYVEDADVVFVACCGRATRWPG